ncbi:hypothetical protein NT01EI_2474 [Edwardsiella ictaluri 93-146]|uniref:Uncharacterized protein n=1 Tax=Edwardsiella ictaluri (strain 93-146) TaxID=634503 RepID=C5BBT9_EDWI9|nr:hypothetical protein NT01EI_2474 [Edwardsiella ictaluri 93-146]
MTEWGGARAPPNSVRNALVMLQPEQLQDMALTARALGGLVILAAGQ